jgi:hypothetical protein
MFSLSAADLARTILGCADGPASFNAELTNAKGRVVSCDPLYLFADLQIRKRIAESCELVIEQTKQNENAFVWDHIGSVERLKKLRMDAMEIFLRDYDEGKREGRYVYAELPRLPFSDRSFDLALCSHFLFLYSAQLSLQEHIDAVREMCRVAGEVRIFPLMSLSGNPSPHLRPVMAAITEMGLIANVELVPYEFQKNANQMLRINGAGRPLALT